MATEVKKRPINRLQTMYALRDLMDKQYKDTANAKEEGKPIAWCMAEAFSSPFLNTMDIESVYTENYATHCAATGAATDYVDRSESEGFPSHLCGYAQNCFGYAARLIDDMGGEIPPEAPRGGMPKPDLLIGSCGNSCDARYKWFQALEKYLDAPLWVMETVTPGQREALLPGAYDNNVNFIVNHLKEFVNFLERLYKKKFDYDKFAADIDSTVEMNDLWWEITDKMRMAIPSPMNSRDHFSAMSASLFRTTDPKAVRDLYDNMRDEVQHRIDNGIAGINYEEKYRASFQGLGPWHGLILFDKLAEKGWNFPREGYHPPDPIDLSHIKDPIERLVRYRYQGLERQIDNSFGDEEGAEVKKEIMERGYSKRASVGTDARDYQVDGVILHTALTCRMTSCRTGLTQQLLRDVWKVPSLLVQGDMIDSRLFDLDDFLRKCEAFEETMDYYRDERKKAGMAW